MKIDKHKFAGVVKQLMREQGVMFFIYVDNRDGKFFKFLKRIGMDIPDSGNKDIIGVYPEFYVCHGMGVYPNRISMACSLKEFKKRLGYVEI